MTRILISFDGTSWFIRRIAVIEHDLEHDDMIYRCDKPLGGPFGTVHEAVAALEIEAAMKIIHTDPCECVWTSQEGLVTPCRDHAAFIAMSVAAEREACAAICDECNRQDESDNGAAMTGAASVAAERIRARS